MVTRTTVYFDAPYQVVLHQEELPAPRPGEVLVQTLVSAVSAGTEMIFYRGQVPPGMTADATISHLEQSVRYPIAYGYAAVGRVIACGPDTPAHLLDQRVFAFQPHTTHFLAKASELLPIPAALDFESAALLPNMETAVNLLMDARPLLGERVVIFGQGVVGLLTTALLAQFPLADLIAIDGYAKRLRVARSLGATQMLTAQDLPMLARLDPDLIIEVSSNPDALAAAIDISGFGTRIVVGSWYGQKPVTLPLGGPFHRNRVQIVSSQVSTLDGSLQNRWTKTRRFDVAWQQLQRIPVGDLITHRMPIHQAAEVYQLIDQQPDEVVQIIFTY